MELNNKSTLDKVIKLRKFTAYEGFISSLRKIFMEIQKEELYIPDFKIELDLLINNLIDEVSGYDEYFLEMISCLEMPDNFVSHCLNTAILSLIFSTCLKIDQKKQRELITAALFHDAGKINFVENIKIKYIYREEDKKKIFKNHPIWGERILISHLRMNQQIARLVLNHHEQLDGAGFPRNLKESELTIYDNILFTANLIDNAMKKVHYPCLDSLRRLVELILDTHGDKFLRDMKSVLHEIFILKDEKRRHIRYKYKAKGMLDDLVKSVRVFCEINNISSGGVGISTPEKLYESSIYQINSKISPNLIFKDKFCKVMWNSSQGTTNYYGIKFDTPADLFMFE
jgi:hypothetical protein